VGGAKLQRRSLDVGAVPFADGANALARATMSAFPAW